MCDAKNYSGIACIATIELLLCHSLVRLVHYPANAAAAIITCPFKCKFYRLRKPCSRYRKRKLLFRCSFAA